MGRVLLHKPAVSQLGRKILANYGTRSSMALSYKRPFLVSTRIMIEDESSSRTPIIFL
jgi:hypothetical protein